MTSKRFIVNKTLALAGSALGLLLVVGCGDTTGLAKRYAVTGNVSYQGKPLEKGTINFIPAKADAGRPATGDIVNGYYSLTTADKDDGALPGSYKVTVASVVMDPEAEAKLKEFSKGGQSRLGPETKGIMKGAIKSSIPSKFSLADTSGLTAEVKEQSNKIDFNLPD